MFVDLVLCKHENNPKPFLFYVSPFSNIKPGESVIVDTKHGNKTAIVVDCYTVDTSLPIFDFIIKAAEATKPLRKVLCKIEQSVFEYEADLLEEMEKK